MGKIYFNHRLITSDTSPTSREENKLKSFLKDWKLGKETFILQTSGSTGKPGKIGFTREQLIASAELTLNTFGLQEGSNFFCPLSVDHVAGFMMIIRTLVAGGNLWLVEPSRIPFSPSDLEMKYDFAPFVPVQLEAIIDDGKYLPVLNKMKSIILGGADISQRLLHKIEKIDTPVFHTYGMTETLTHIAIRQLNGEKKEDFFHPLKGVQVGVNENNRLKIIASHLNKDLLTNDVAEVNSNQSFRIIGRFDDIINTGGFKVHPAIVEKELEKAFGQMALSPGFLVTSLPDEEYGEKVVLVIEGSKKEPSFFQRIKDELKSSLPPYSIPKEVFFLPEFPYLKSGKVDKMRLKEKLMALKG